METVHYRKSLPEGKCYVCLQVTLTPKAPFSLKRKINPTKGHIVGVSDDDLPGDVKND